MWNIPGLQDRSTNPGTKADNVHSEWTTGGHKGWHTEHLESGAGAETCGHVFCWRGVPEREMSVSADRIQRLCHHHQHRNEPVGTVYFESSFFLPLNYLTWVCSWPRTPVSTGESDPQAWLGSILGYSCLLKADLSSSSSPSFLPSSSPHLPVWSPHDSPWFFLSLSCPPWA